MKRVSILFTSVLCLALSAGCNGAEDWGGASAEIAALGKSKQNKCLEKSRSVTPVFNVAPNSLFKSISIEEIEDLMRQAKIQKDALLAKKRKNKRATKARKMICFEDRSLVVKSGPSKKAYELQAVWHNFQANKENEG